jgi:hypothetical protein
MQYTITLKANTPLKQTFQGDTLVLLDLGAATQLSNLDIEIKGYSTEQYRNVKRGFKFRGPVFGAATFRSPVDATIEVVVSNADITVNYQDGNTVNANIVGTVPVQVTGHGTAPADPLFVNGQVETPANNVTDNAGVAAGPVAANLLAADPTRLEAVIFNQGPAPVTIGMAGITWAKRAIVLNQGDTWIESRAAAKAWQVITDAGLAATVTVQERKA